MRLQLLKVPAGPCSQTQDSALGGVASQRSRIGGHAVPRGASDTVRLVAAASAEALNIPALERQFWAITAKADILGRTAAPLETGRSGPPDQSGAFSPKPAFQCLFPSFVYYAIMRPGTPVDDHNCKKEDH